MSARTLLKGAAGVVNSSAWFTTFPTSSGIVQAIHISSLGNIFIITDGPVLYKLNSKGVFQWKVTASKGVFTGASIITDASENIYIAFDSYHYPEIHKFNSSGVFQWYLGLGGMPASPTLSSIGKMFISANGNINLLASSGNTNDSAYCPAWMYTFTSTGTVVNQILYYSPAPDYWYKIWTIRDSFIDSSNIYLFCLGPRYSSYNELYIVKLNLDGTLSAVFYAGFYPAVEISGSVDSSGNIYVAAYDNNNYNFIGKYNSSGTLVWSKQMTTPTTAKVCGVLATDSGVYVAYPDFTFVKLNTDGTVAFTRQWTSTSKGVRTVIKNGDNIIFGGGGNQSSGNTPNLFTVPLDGTLTGKNNYTSTTAPVFGNYPLTATNLTASTTTVTAIRNTGYLNTNNIWTKFTTSDITTVYNP